MAVSSTAMTVWVDGPWATIGMIRKDCRSSLDRFNGCATSCSERLQPQAQNQKSFCGAFFKKRLLACLNRDADAEFDHAVAGDAEEFCGGDCVARHEQEQPAADEA